MEPSLDSILVLKSDPLDLAIITELQNQKYEAKCLKLLSFDYEIHEKALFDKLRVIDTYQGLAMNSSNAINAIKKIMDKYKDFKIGSIPSTCVVGEKTATALRNTCNVDPVIIGKNLAELMPNMKAYFELNNENPKILYLVGSLSDIASHVTPEDKCSFDPVVCYETVECSEEEFYLNMDELNMDSQPKAIIYFSPSNARTFASYIAKYLESRGKSWAWEEIEHVAFGDKTKEELNKLKESLRIRPMSSVHVCKMSQVKEIPKIIGEIVKK